MAPTLAVIMPNYNHGKYISRAIEAVTGQSRAPDEYIILDDGSTDNSLEIIQSYARRYNFIKVLKNETNHGIHYSVNKLLDAVTSDYIYGGAADDWVLPGFFEKAMDMAEKYPDAGIIFGKHYKTDEAGRILSESAVEKWTEAGFINPERYLKEYLLVYAAAFSFSISCIYKKENLEEVGRWREELGTWCDTFALRAIALKYGACYIPEPCASFVHHLDSLSNKTTTKGILDITSNAASLMRTQDFSDIFPADYVSYWEREFAEFFIRQEVDKIRRLFADILASSNEIRKNSALLQSMFLRFCNKLIKGFCRIYLPHISRNLWAYWRKCKKR